MAAAFPGEIRIIPFDWHILGITESYCMRVLNNDHPHLHKIQFSTCNNRSIRTREADAEGVFWLQPTTRSKTLADPWLTVHVPKNSFTQVKLVAGK